MTLRGLDRTVRCEVETHSSGRSDRNRRQQLRSHSSSPKVGIRTVKGLSHSLKDQYNIGTELEYQMGQDSDLRSSILRALERLSKEFPEADIEAFVEHEMEAEDIISHVIRIIIDYDSVQKYSHLKDKVREIVRESEEEEVMLYTRIKRPQ